MNRLIRLAILILILGAFGTLYAEQFNTYTGFGVEAGGCYGDNAGYDEGWGPRVRGVYQLKLGKPFFAQAGLSYSYINGGDEYSSKTAILDTRLLYSPFSTDKVFPFLYAGMGVAKNLNENDSDFIPVVPFGFGAQTVIGEQMLLTISGGYNLAISDELGGPDPRPNNNDLNRFTNKKHDGFFELMFGFTYTKPLKHKKEVIKEEPPKIIIIEAAAPVEKPVDKALLDSDKDGLTDEAELTIHKTDPFNRDSDSDGLSDGDEVLKYKTDPLSKDTDGDGLTDGDEVLKYKTDPLKKDTDGDGLTDGDEVLKYKTDPLKADTDGDGLSDADEVLKYKTDPTKIESDNGGMNDGAEIKMKKNPLDPADDLFDMSKGKKIVLEGITFASAKAEILPTSKTVLEKVRESLEANPDVTILIVGHTDSQGNDSYNQTLSLKRAQAVKEWLVRNNIKSNRIKVEGKGEMQPTATNETAAGRAQNRRIEFTVE